MDALAGAAGLFQRDTAHGGFSFVFDVGLPIRVSAPPSKGETFLHRLFELYVIGWFDGIGLTEGERAVEECLLISSSNCATAAAIPC